MQRMSLTFKSSNIVLRACYVSGTMLDAKILDMTKTGRSLSPRSQHSSGRDGGKFKDLVYYGRIIPLWQAKAQIGNVRTQAGADRPPLENWDDEKLGRLGTPSRAGEAGQCRQQYVSKPLMCLRT